MCGYIIWITHIDEITVRVFDASQFVISLFFFISNTHINRVRARTMNDNNDETSIIAPSTQYEKYQLKSIYTNEISTKNAPTIARVRHTHTHSTNLN